VGGDQIHHSAKASRVTCKRYCHCEGRALQDLYFSTSLHKHLKTADTHRLRKSQFPVDSVTELSTAEDSKLYNTMF